MIKSQALLDNWLYMLTIRQLKIEVNAHIGEDGRTCTICWKKFSQKYHLTRHIRSHLNIRFSCPICGKMYTQITNLRNHVKRSHSQYFLESKMCKDVGSVKDIP